MAPNTAPLPRFRRAVARGSLLQAEAAARELGRIELDDALRLLLLLLRDNDPRFERAALRFMGRVLAERPAMTFELADTLLDGLSELNGVSPDVARSRVALALRAAGLDEAAAYISSGADVGGWR